MDAAQALHEHLPSEVAPVDPGVRRSPGGIVGNQTGAVGEVVIQVATRHADVGRALGSFASTFGGRSARFPV